MSVPFRMPAAAGTAWPVRHLHGGVAHGLRNAGGQPVTHGEGGLRRHIRGAKPVPPVVTMRSTGSRSHHCRRAASIRPSRPGQWRSPSPCTRRFSEFPQPEARPRQGALPGNSVADGQDSGFEHGRSLLHDSSSRMASGGTETVRRSLSCTACQLSLSSSIRSRGASGAAPSGRSSTMVENTSSTTFTAVQEKAFSAPGPAS